ncbi:MAG: HlyC/CorC family transporter [Phycisphaerales bacterium]|nr:HlyC/CorC family transporter [Phycisphaerales bacterium]
MDSTDLPFLIVLAVLLVCSAFASASETAFFGLSRADRVKLGRSHPHIARIVDRLLASPRALLTQVLLVNMVANIGYFVVTSVLTLHADSAIWRIGISVGSLIVIVLVGEVLAKLLAAAAPSVFLTIGAPIHAVIARITQKPMGVFDRFVIAPLTRLVSPRARTVSVSSQEMGALLELSRDEGLIDAGEEELLQAIIGLHDLQGEVVMTPRVDISWVQADADRARVLELYESTGRSRFPVCEESLDGGVIGIVDARLVLEGKPVRRAMVKPLFVPEQIRLDQLLDRFRTTGSSVAVCVDEHGGVCGLVTLTDIIDELLRGYAEPEEDPASSFQMVSVGRWIVPGRLGIHDWLSYFARDNEFKRTSRAQTLGGLVMVLLGRLPKAGDSVHFGGSTLRVVEMHGRSVHSVEVVLDDAPELPTTSGTGGAS